MLTGLLMLLVLSGIMTFASFVCGMMPLAITLTNRQLRLISALGTGILVGTALAVIIPEGIHSIYEAGESHTSITHSSDGTSNVASLQTRWLSEGSFGSGLPNVAWSQSKVARMTVSRRDEGTNRESGSSEELSTSPASPEGDETKSTGDKDAGDAHDNDAHNKKDTSIEALVALSLILGFVLMYLIDTIPKSSSVSRDKSLFHMSLPNFGRGLHPSKSTVQASLSENSVSQTLTMGLLVHAFADGIALGAATTAAGVRESVSSTSFLFLAIILHKGPAAFSLAALLLRQGAGKRVVKKSVLIFSLAAPVGAIVTWFLVQLVSTGQKSGASLWPGCVLLFSGGTFLYVASHALHADSHHSSGQSNAYPLTAPSNPYDPFSRESNLEDGVSPTGDKYGQGQPPSRMEILLTVFGMLLPTLIVVSGGHSH